MILKLDTTNITLIFLPLSTLKNQTEVFFINYCLFFLSFQDARLERNNTK